MGGYSIKKMRLIPIKKIYQADYYELYFVLDVLKMIQTMIDFVMMHIKCSIRRKNRLIADRI